MLGCDPVRHGSHRSMFSTQRVGGACLYLCDAGVGDASKENTLQSADEIEGQRIPQPLYFIVFSDFPLFVEVQSIVSS